MVDNEILLIDQEIDKTPAKIRFDQTNDGEGLLKKGESSKKIHQILPAPLNFPLGKRLCRFNRGLPCLPREIPKDSKAYFTGACSVARKMVLG